jgi:hypothetical protein
VITRQQAVDTEITRFHEEHEPAGKIYEWRRNGATQTWKTRPDDFRLPIKYGQKSYDNITPANAHLMHAEQDCPTRHVTGTVPDGGEFTGIVIEELAPDNAGYGITLVQVTRKGTSPYRVGSQQRVRTGRLTYL